MENNDKDFLKNRPVVSNLNQAKDVYGPMKKGGVALITLVLSLVLLGCSIYDFVCGRYIWGSIFATVFLALFVSVLVSSVNTPKDMSVENKEHPDAIFKDYEE